MEFSEAGCIGSVESRWARAGLWLLVVLGACMCGVAWWIAMLEMAVNLACAGGSSLFQCDPGVGGVWMVFLSAATAVATSGAFAGIVAFIWDEWRLPVGTQSGFKIQ